jgi:FO synthase
VLLTQDRLDPATEDLLAKAAAQEAVSRQEAYRLMRATASELPALMLAASLVRDRHKGNLVTYSRKAFIPLTNLCRDTCGYCTFVRQPDEPQAHTMTPEEVLAVAKAARGVGCKEALFSLGDRPEAKYPEHSRWLERRGYSTTLEYLRDMCELVHKETGLLPHANPGVMTREDIAALREVNASMGIMLENVSSSLLRPEEAHHRCPDKVPKRRLATLEYAGQMKVAFTTGILIGIGETLEERVDSLFAIKQIHERYGHIQEVIIQNFRTKPDIPMRDHPEPTLLDMLCTIAVARLILGGRVNIQAPPNLTPDAYQMYLLAGINDWGGVSPLTKDFINPERPWPKIQELRVVTEEAGFRLRERLSTYPEYVVSGDGFIPPSLAERVLALTDGQGLVKEEEEKW